MISYTKAILVHKYHRELTDGTRIDIVIWKLPNSTAERPHGFKYRLNYSSTNGETIVRFDNRSGKADHKHIRDKQLPYEFKSVEQLFIDFEVDVIEQGGKLW